MSEKQTAIQIIQQNLPWIFSGVGVFVLTLIFRPKSKSEKEKNTLNAPNPSNSFIQQNKAETIIQNNYLTQEENADQKNPEDLKPSPKIHKDPNFHDHPMPSEIRNDLKKMSPFQQDAMKKNYENIPVLWKLKLNAVRTGDKKDIVGISALEATESLINPLFEGGLIFFDIDIETYPKFKIAHEGEIFFVKGKIKEIWGTGMSLKDCSIEFEK